MFFFRFCPITGPYRTLSSLRHSAGPCRLPTLYKAAPTPFFEPTLALSQRPPGSPPALLKGFLLQTRPLSRSLRCGDGPVSEGCSGRAFSSRRLAALTTTPPGPRRPQHLTAGPPPRLPPAPPPARRGPPDTRVSSVHLGLPSSPQPPNRHRRSPLTRPGK